MAKRGLGKGLNELLSSTLGDQPDVVIDPQNVEQEPTERATTEQALGIHRLPIDKLVSGPFQPRTAMEPEALEQLRGSISRQGILQPIVVRPNENHYEIIAGERRWRAATLAGLSEIPAIVKTVSDEEAMAIGLIENIQRENLNPMDTAKGLKRLSDEMDLTHLEVAEAVGKSRTSVTNLIRLLTLNEDVQAMLEGGQIEMGHARALLGVKGFLQSQMAKTIIKRGLSVRETERIIQRLQDPESKGRRSGQVDPNIRRLETDLANKLGATVAIRHTQKGKGSLVIQYNDAEELEGILEHFQ